MPQAVLFDMFETLITHYGAPLYFGTEMAAEAGVAAEVFLPLWRRTDDDRTLGRRRLEDVLEELYRSLGCYSPALVDGQVQKRKASKQECFRHLHPEILPMLSGLRQRGMRVGLISNCYFEEAEVIRQSPLFPCFDAVMLSCEQGVMKPDPEIFRRCTDALGVTPGQCLYVGDGGSRELETARSLGMTTVQAVWYLLEGSTQPCQRKAEFPAAERPMDVVRMAEEMCIRHKS
ncbi:MAG: HAD family hydrolase [Clostridiales bacterium]|nr:HAD family hydrolase [Clostridiales bacterium]